MFALGTTFARTSRHLLALGLTAWVATAPLAAAGRGPVDSVPLLAGETWRGPGGAPGDDATLSIRLDTPGVLLIDVAVPVAAPAVRLVLLRPKAPGSDDVQVLGQSPTALVLAAPPGDYVLRVAADDPRQPLAPWRLRTRFAAAPLAPATAWKSGSSTQIEIDPDPVTSGSSTQIEIDPDPVTSGSSTQIEIDPDPVTSGSSTQIEIDPDPVTSGSSTQIEIDPDPVTGLGDAQSAASRLLRELCRQGEIDDHGDSFACATPLAPRTPARGAFGNDHGDDSDLFRFEVSALAPVELRARASFALAGELYDRHGQRLDTAVAEGSDGLRLVRTLVPGTYFLRLQGWQGAEGTYTVTFGHPRQAR